MKIEWPTWQSTDGEEQDRLRRFVLRMFALGAFCCAGFGFIIGFLWRDL